MKHICPLIYGPSWLNLPNIEHNASHSTKIKCFNCVKLNLYFRARGRIIFGVPIMTWASMLSVVSTSALESTRTLIFNDGMKRLYSVLIFEAKSEVKHKTKIEQWISVSSNCFIVIETNIAVLPKSKKNQNSVKN